MKNIIYFLLVPFISFTVLYLLVSFANASLNISTWNEHSRDTVVGVTIAITIVYGLIRLIDKIGSGEII